MIAGVDRQAVTQSDDALGLLELLHAGAKRLQELAGDAIRIDVTFAGANGDGQAAAERKGSAKGDDGEAAGRQMEGPAAEPEPPPPARGVWRSDRTAEAARHNDGVVVAFFAARRDEWAPLRTVAAELGVNTEQARLPLKRLLASEVLEHNGRSRTASAYRLKNGAAGADLPFDSESGAPELESPAGADLSNRHTGPEYATDREPPRQLDPAELERRRAAERVDRIEERKRREAERAEVAGDRQDDGDGTPLGRALSTLALKPSTIPELAAQLGVEKKVAARLVRALEDDGDLERNGRRNGEIHLPGQAVNGRERQVLELVAYRGAVRVPEVADATGLSSAEVVDALIELEGGGSCSGLRLPRHARRAGGR